jgi:putative ABC transport system substrate-binding protein
VILDSTALVAITLDEPECAALMLVQLKRLDIQSPEDAEAALTEMRAWRAEAMMTFSGPLAVTNALPRLVDFEVQNRVPLAWDVKDGVQGGALLAYGASFNEEGRIAATYVDKIIRGATPADLPVEQPTLFELVVNQTTAHALGITIPPDVAAQVTEWIT